MDIEKRNSIISFAFFLAAVAIVIYMFFNFRVAVILALIYISVVVVIKYPSILTTIGRNRYAFGDSANGYKWFERAWRTGHLNSANLNFYAYMQLKIGDTTKCLKALEFLSKKDMTDREYVKYKSTLSLLLWKTDKKHEAMGVAEEVIADYRNTIIYGTLGYYKLEMLPINEALDFNREAYDYSSSDPVIIDNYAACLIKNGEPEKAIEIYEKIISNEILFPEIYYNYGTALMKIGETDRAETAFSQALECNFSFTSTIQKEEIVDALKNLKK